MEKLWFGIMLFKMLEMMKIAEDERLQGVAKQKKPDLLRVVIFYYQQFIQL